MLKYLHVASFVVIAVLCVTVYALIKSNNSLREEKTLLNIELNQTINKLDAVIKNNNDIQEYNKELFRTVDEYRVKTQDLNSKLSKLESKSDKIAKKHPKLLSNALNKSTKQINECFEKISKGEECE